jgi:hypothetical protein
MMPAGQTVNQCICSWTPNGKNVSDFVCPNDGIDLRVLNTWVLLRYSNGDSSIEQELRMDADFFITLTSLSGNANPVFVRTMAEWRSATL